MYKNRKNQLASTSRQRKHTKGGVHTTNQPPNNSDLSNLSPTNLPVDDFEPEKEVSEEKEDPLAVRREEGGGRWRKEERGRTKQRMSLEEQGTSAQEETSSRVQTQPVKRGKASMPMREWDSFLYEPPISPSNLFQTVVDEDRFSLLLNWTQHPAPSQNREVGSFVVELSTDGGTTFQQITDRYSDSLSYKLHDERCLNTVSHVLSPVFILQ